MTGGFPSAMARNAVIAGTTGLRHLREDPAVFVLQLSRRLPTRVSGRAARLVLRRTSRGSVSPLTLTAELVAGRRDELRRRLERAVDLVRRSGRRTRTRTRWAAEIAVAGGFVEVADRLIDAASGPSVDPALGRTVARRRWYAGDMSGAVAAVAQPGNDALAHRLEAERRVYRGWTPSATTAPVAPVPGRVLHLLTNSLPHTGSGYAQRSHSILLAQRQSGLEPLAVTRVGYPVQVGRLLARDVDEVDGVTYRRLLPLRLEATAQGRLQQQTDLLLEIARRFRPTAVHTTTDFTNGLVARAVARSLGVPFIYEVRGQLADTWASTRPDAARQSERYRLFTARETEVMRSADHVITLGAAMRESIVAAGVPVERITLAPNAVGGAFLEEPVSPGEARSRLGLPDDGPIVGTVSSLVDYEGLDDLVLAVALLAERYPTVRLMVVGSGAAEPGLQRLIAEAGLAGRTIFTGRVTRELAPLHHQALDVFVVPRKDRAVTRVVTPLKPVEALASARPVVASDLPALREIVDDGVNGLLVPPENPAALAAGLGRLLDDEALRMRMGTAGRTTTLAHRTWTANARVMANIYDNPRGGTP